MNKPITPLKALEILREYSRQGIPASIKYLSHKEKDKTSKGIVEENGIFLCAGYRRNQSKKHDVLVSFLRINENERRQFYWPLLLEINGRTVKP